MRPQTYGEFYHPYSKFKIELPGDNVMYNLVNLMVVVWVLLAKDIVIQKIAFYKALLETPPTTKVNFN